MTITLSATENTELNPHPALPIRCRSFIGCIFSTKAAKKIKLLESKIHGSTYMMVLVQVSSSSIRWYWLVSSSSNRWYWLEKKCMDLLI